VPRSGSACGPASHRPLELDAAAGHFLEALAAFPEGDSRPLGQQGLLGGRAPSRWGKTSRAMKRLRQRMISVLVPPSAGGVRCSPWWDRSSALDRSGRTPRAGRAAW
jgi:hypothetical protein